ncbi:MAG: hypothetical protein WBZ37_27020 [Mycobacterium sp.]
MNPAKLPEDISQIVDHLALAAIDCGGKMKSDEVAKLKSDMMQMRGRWNVHRVSGRALSKRCRAAGLSDEDTALVIDLLRRVQVGGYLVPQSSYRGFRFPFSLSAGQVRMSSSTERGA